jgi:hypothetical protein
MELKDLTTISTILQQNMINASQMQTLLAKLPDIPQDFDSLVNNLACDSVETLVVDAFGGRLDYFVADSI